MSLFLWASRLPRIHHFFIMPIQKCAAFTAIAITALTSLLLNQLTTHTQVMLVSHVSYVQSHEQMTIPVIFTLCSAESDSVGTRRYMHMDKCVHMYVYVCMCAFTYIHICGRLWQAMTQANKQKQKNTRQRGRQITTAIAATSAENR